MTRLDIAGHSITRASPCWLQCARSPPPWRELARNTSRFIVEVGRQQGVEPVFVPQILNCPVLTSDRPYGWLPFVRDRDLKTVMAAHNAAMAKVAREENVLFVEDVLKPDYGAADFVDNGHFSPSGHEKFARALAPKLAALKSPAARKPAGATP